MPIAPQRAIMKISLAPFATGEQFGIRAPRPEDVPDLGALMFQSYQGTVDYDGETEEQSVEEVRKTFDGEYGAFDAAYSRVLERDGRILSATLLTRWQDRPFVAFSMTHPDAKNQGLARACMRSAMEALAAAGQSELRLVVTLANVPAVGLYKSLGFELEGEQLPG